MKTALFGCRCRWLWPSAVMLGLAVSNCGGATSDTFPEKSYGDSGSGGAHNGGSGGGSTGGYVGTGGSGDRGGSTGTAGREMGGAAGEGQGGRSTADAGGTCPDAAPRSGDMCSGRMRCSYGREECRCTRVDQGRQWECQGGEFSPDGGGEPPPADDGG
jgi:hypothetical protein